MTEQEAINYFKHITIDTKIGLENIAKTSEIINISIKALEKQIPKMPSCLTKHKDFFNWECPKCHMSYGMATFKVRYCPNCGQAIKWE